MTSQKRAKSSNTKSQSSLRNKNETVLNSMREELLNFYVVLKLSWKLSKLKWSQYFLPELKVEELIKKQEKPSQTSSPRSTQAVASKSQSVSKRKVGSPRSTPKKAVSSSTKPRSKASTSPKRKPSQNT